MSDAGGLQSSQKARTPINRPIRVQAEKLEQMVFSACMIQNQKRTKEREARELERSGIPAASKTFHGNQSDKFFLQSKNYKLAQ